MKIRVKTECPKCNGHGEIVLAWNTNGTHKQECPRCKGTGLCEMYFEHPKWVSCEVVK